MKKISTLFKKDPTNLGRVIDEINPGNEWCTIGGAIPTRKYDGTACAIINGQLYKRYDVRLQSGDNIPKKRIPDRAISCGPPDTINGHWPHWIPCGRNNPEDKWHFEAFDDKTRHNRSDGTYELCGPKINGNREQLPKHKMIRHGADLIPCTDNSFESLKKLLGNDDLDIEGIVFYSMDGKMCKIRKKDFGIKRILK